MLNRWLTKQEYSKIKYKAKKLGAKQVSLNYLWHSVSFEHTVVTFIFKPFEYRINLISTAFMQESDFTDSAGAESIYQEMQRALEFVEFLKEFEKVIQA